MSNRKVVSFSIGFLFLSLFLYGGLVLHILVSIFIYLFVVSRVFTIQTRKRIKTALIISYSMLLPIQITSFVLYVFGVERGELSHHLIKLSGIFLLIIPFIVEGLTTISRSTVFSIPSIQDVDTVSYALLNSLKNDWKNTKVGVHKIRHSVSPYKLKEIIKDLPRHSSLAYVNNGSLTEEYFEDAYRSLEDPHIYIVVSNTGSAASELISVFTRKLYNHVSLAFDPGLKTIISYNGGERVFPPGLNIEMIDFFNKKEDASIIVYRLKASREQKKALVDKVKEINREGSAYNLIGLIFKYSHKPNIMFCSQFVYTMLKFAGLEYFDKKAAEVQPTDLVELDYYRKLEFGYEIKFN